jgi:hypothetical protein
MTRKLLGWAIVAFLIFYVVSDPAGAAHAARGGLSVLHTAGTSLSAFVSRI